MNSEEIANYMGLLCDLAARETLPRFRTRSNITNKLEEGFDPVTEADREAERVIRKTIMRDFPDHGIIGEEMGGHNGEAEYVWIIDPIDGTRAFIAGLPVWGTLIGLYKNGEPLAGVMDQPFTGERFMCDGVTSRFQHADISSLMATSPVKTPNKATLMTTGPELFTADEKSCFDRLSEQCRLTRYGADCYATAMLACGNIEYVAEAGLNQYDIAALIPIVEKAGGVFTDWDGNPNPRGGRILASANQTLHEHGLALLNKAA